jgi:hypothetical protein
MHSEIRLTVDQRLTQEGQRLRDQAKAMPEGPERKNILIKASCMDAARRMQQWLSPKPSQLPK